jgi:cell division protein FtsB
MADGLIYQKYNINEVSKAVDTVVDELAPKIPEAAPNVVSAESLDNANATIAGLQSQLADLSNQTTSLNNEINSLKTQAETDKNKRLSVEQENDIVVNQLDSLSKVLNQLTDQLSVALQKSIDESVMRTSLHAANQGYKAQIEAYIKQIDTLNNLIFGLQAQLGAIQEQRVLEQSNFQQQILLTQQQLQASQQSLTDAELQLLQLQQQQAALLAAGTGGTSTGTGTNTSSGTGGTGTSSTSGTTAGTGTTSTTLPAGDVANKVAVVNLAVNNYPTRAKIYGRFQAAAPVNTWNTANNSAFPSAKWGNGQSITVFNSDTQPITVNILPSFSGTNAFKQKTPVWFSVSQTLATLQPNETKTFSLTLNWAETAGMDSRQEKNLFGTYYTNSKQYDSGIVIVKVTRSDGTIGTVSYTTQFDVIHPNSWT